MDVERFFRSFRIVTEGRFIGIEKYQTGKPTTFAGFTHRCFWSISQSIPRRITLNAKKGQGEE